MLAIPPLKTGIQMLNHECDGFLNIAMQQK